jgi:ribosome maturation factor RimP
MVERTKQKVTDLIEAPLTEVGCDLVEVVLSRFQNNWTLRLFVYAGESTTIAECAKVSRLVGELIDSSDLLEEGYTLEVSSPGLDRPLKTVRDFAYRTGENVRIDFVDSKRRHTTGKILGATDTTVEFEGGDGPFSVPLDEIASAKIKI